VAWNRRRFDQGVPGRTPLPHRAPSRRPWFRQIEQARGRVRRRAERTPASGFAESNVFETFVSHPPRPEHSAGRSSQKSVAQSVSRNRAGVDGFRYSAGMAGELLGYARVSTTDQDAALQVDALQAVGCFKVFVDTGSGSLDERPELQRLREQLRPDDTVVVWRLGRLGRSIRHLIDTMTELNDQGVGFRSLTENIDTTTPGGRLVFHLFAALAEFERDLIRDRTKAGLAAARARGRLGGRPRALTSDQVAAARAMYDQQDMTVAQIGEVLGVSRATIYRALGKEPVAGKRPTARAGG